MSTMDNVADVLHEALCNTDEACIRDLQTAMAEMQKFHRTLRDLNRIPGFRKLWDAMECAIEFHAEQRQ